MTPELNTVEYLAEGVCQSHLLMIRERNALLSAKVEALSALVRRIPALITSARLDVREGKQTTYNYDEHARVLNLPEA